MTFCTSGTLVDAARALSGTALTGGAFHAKAAEDLHRGSKHLLRHLGGMTWPSPLPVFFCFYISQPRTL